MNHNEELRGRFNRDLPGIQDDAIGDCFSAIRDSINASQGKQETGVIKMLGQLAETYIKQLPTS